MDIARGYAIGTLALGVALTVVGVQLTRHRPGWRGRYRKGAATIVLGGFLAMFGLVDLVFDPADTAGSVLRGVLSAAALLVGIALAVGSMREYVAHPE